MAQHDVFPLNSYLIAMCARVIFPRGRAAGRNGDGDRRHGGCVANDFPGPLTSSFRLLIKDLPTAALCSREKRTVNYGGPNTPNRSYYDVSATVRTFRK